MLDDLTYAQRRPHDLTHFTDPSRLVSGQIMPPVVCIENEKIIRRHLHAIALAAFFRAHPETFGSVKAFFEPGSLGLDGPQLLQAYLTTRPESVGQALLRVIPRELQEEVGVNTWGWVGELVNGENGSLDLVSQEVRSDLNTYTRLADEAYRERRGREGDLFTRIAETLRRRELLKFLASRNILPRYGFPVDVVPLELLHVGEEAQRLDLERDRKIAIAEYAPGSQIVAGGWLWTSSGLKVVRGRAWERFYYAVCPTCGRYQRTIETPLGGSCIACGGSLQRGRGGLAGFFVIPEFGFLSSREAPTKPGDSRPRRTYASRVFFAEYNSEQGATEPAFTWEGRPPQAGSIGLKTRYSRRGKLVVINGGRRGRGFLLCEACGYGEPAPPPGRSRRRGPHPSPRGSECSSTLFQAHLGHEFQSDVLELQFTGHLAPDEGLWRSLTYALLEGASRALGIRREDLDGCLYPFGRAGEPPAIILYDTVPGGAGHVSRLQTVLRGALICVASCPDCSEDSSCYACLCNYWNQPYHSQLKRGPVRMFLEHLIPVIYDS